MYSLIYYGNESSPNSHYEKFILTGEVKCIDDEIPFELPKGWEWCRLGEVFLHASGKQQSSANNLSGTPRKYITTSNVYWGLFDLKTLKVMNFTDFEIESKSATKGDLLVCEGGAGYGRSAIWKEDYDICLQNHLHRLRPCIKGICEYVFYLLYLLKESNQLASVGTAMPGLSASSLKNILLPLPPLAEQQRIVAKIEELMPLVEQYGKAQSKLEVLNTNIREQLKKSILQYAIEGKLVPQCEEDGTAEDLLQAIQAEKQRLYAEGKLKKKDLTHSTIFRGEDNKYYEKTILTGEVKCIDEEIPFEIPISWRWVRLADISIFLSRGKSPKYSDVKQIPVFAQKCNLKSGGISLDEVKFLDASTLPKWKDEYKLRHQDILINSTGTGTVGRIGVFSESLLGNYPFIVPDSHISVVRLSSACNPLYIFNVLSSNAVQSYIEDNLAGSTNQKELYIGTLGKLLIPLPPMIEQQKIIHKIEVVASIMTRKMEKLYARL